MPREQNPMEVYFDEAGYTGENLDDLSQSNLFLAAIAIPPEIAREFWRRAERAWEIGSRSLGVPLNELELKGHDIYTGRGRFSGLTGSIRVEILEAIFNTLVDLRVPIFWEGLPKHEWRRHELPSPFWANVLVHFCDNLYQLLSSIYPGMRFHIAGDENAFIGANRLLQHRDPNRWPQLAGDGFEFYCSSGADGIQIADVVAHTLYRANRAQQPPPGAVVPVLSNTDLTAQRFHARLSEGNLWINVSTALHRINEYCMQEGPATST